MLVSSELMAEQIMYTKDELTGLLTRNSLKLFLENIEKQKFDQKLSVFAVEISRFGVVNGSVGTATADKIIATTAKRLIKTFPDALAISRLHGDHFGIVFDESVYESEALEKLLDFAQRPLAIRGEAIALSVRVGISNHALITEDTYELVHAAEVALLHSKKSMAKVSHFEKNMIENARSLHSLENDLRISLVTKAAELHQAISNSEFELFYQPIVDLKKRQLHSCEALLRWNHPKRGMVSPAVFIPLAEQIHVMSVLGNWIIRRACADAVSWNLHSTKIDPPSVSINVSPVQFLEFDVLYTTLTKAIEETGINPRKIHIEITESVNFSITMREQLQEIKDLGCKIALDDFGTGYSSVAQLVELPLDYVKVDRSLVRGLGVNTAPLHDRPTKLARAVLNLAESLEVKSIVEGIETVECLSAIKSLGGELVQGYYYSKPMRAIDTLSYITNFELEGNHD